MLDRLLITFFARHCPRWLAPMSLLLCLGIAPVTLAQDTEAIARSHFQLARAYYESGKFLEAAAEFEKAYQASKKPTLLYNVYLAYRDANEMDKAASALRRFLDEGTVVDNRAQLEARLKIMERDLEEKKARQAAGPGPAAPPATPAATAPAAAAPAPSEAASSTPPEAHASLDLHAEASASSGGGDFPILPVALMAGGGAMVVTSFITGAMSSSEYSTLDEACPNGICPAERQAELEDTKSSGETLAVVTDVLLFGGLAVAGTGLALFLLDSGESESSNTASLACLPGSCYGSVQLTF